MNFARLLSYNSLQAVQISDEKVQEFSVEAVRGFESHLRKCIDYLVFTVTWSMGDKKC